MITDRAGVDAHHLIDGAVGDPGGHKEKDTDEAKDFHGPGKNKKQHEQSTADGTSDQPIFHPNILNHPGALLGFILILTIIDRLPVFAKATQVTANGGDCDDQLAKAVDQFTIHQISIKDAHRFNDLLLLEMFQTSTVIIFADGRFRYSNYRRDLRRNP